MTDREVVSLKAHFDRVIEEERRHDLAVWAGHDKEHEALALALSDAKRELKDWKASANEWRATLADLTGKFASREYAETLVRSNTVRIDDLEKVNDQESGALTERQKNVERRVWAIGIGVGIISIAVNWLINRP